MIRSGSGDFVGHSCMADFPAGAEREGYPRSGCGAPAGNSASEISETSDFLHETGDMRSEGEWTGFDAPAGNSTAETTLEGKLSSISPLPSVKCISPP